MSAPIGAGSAKGVGHVLDLTQRSRLNQLFERLCRIESPSGSERQCADAVIAELADIGVTVSEDDAARHTGGDCGNLLARVCADGRRDPRPSILFCAHLDTVPLAAPVEPVLTDGYWENANEGILGADNKAAVAVMLMAARHLREQGGSADLELLFTVGEERSLAGANVFDTDELLSDWGYVFDHASPIGEIVSSSPSHYRIDADFRGTAAHAGIRPQDGRSAVLAAAHAITSIPQGRLDEHTTVNLASVHGGDAINVVPERCALLAEVRSLSDAQAETITQELVDHIYDAANRSECECDVQISIQRTFSGYQTRANDPAVSAAEAALKSCGYEPRLIASGGASDANALIARGFHTVNLANGTEHNHEPLERVSAQALSGMLDVAITLLNASVTQPQT